jgi:hypothetical protein
MRRRPGAAAGALDLGTARIASLVSAVGLVGLTACTTRPKAAETRGPFLSILQRDAGAAARAPGPRGAVALALGGLAPEELPRLRERLAESTDGALRRVAPGMFDLEGRGGGDGGSNAGGDSVRQTLLDLPALTAATNLLGSPWEAPGIAVHLGPACEPAASRCTPLFAPTAAADDSLVRRGRALAWAAGNAALLRVAPSARDRLLHALREAQLRRSGTLALVFSAPRGALDAAELDRLRQEARRALAEIATDAPQRPWLEMLVDGAAGTDWALPFALDADQVLVIPRLSALARLQDFASEVEGAGAFEWVSRPGISPSHP